MILNQRVGHVHDVLFCTLAFWMFACCIITHGKGRLQCYDLRMTKSEAVRVIEQVRQVLELVGRFESLPPGNRASVSSEAQSLRSRLSEVESLLRKLDQEVKRSRDE